MVIYIILFIGFILLGTILVMTSVYCLSDHQVLMAWKIIHIGEPGRTVEQFFHDVAVSHIESSSSISNIKLDCAYLGRSKESLDQIELSIQLDLAVAVFGGFLRYVVSQEQPAPREPTVNAFEVMMSSQRQLCLRRLPEKKTEHNSKDRLYNAILDLLQEKMLDFPPSEVDSVGINLVKTLQECLWYIDG